MRFHLRILGIEIFHVELLRDRAVLAELLEPIAILDD